MKFLISLILILISIFLIYKICIISEKRKLLKNLNIINNVSPLPCGVKPLLTRLKRFCAVLPLEILTCWKESKFYV